MIALDTDAFSLAIKGIAQSHLKSKSNVAEEKVRSEQGKAFLQKLAEDGDPVMISSVTLGEYLVLIEPDDHAEQLVELAKIVRIYPVDDRAALWAARIRRSTMSSKQIKKAYHERQRLLRLDAFVLAVAVANGATQLISYDERLKSLAESAVSGKITVRPFPPVGTLQFQPPPAQTAGDPTSERGEEDDSSG